MTFNMSSEIVLNEDQSSESWPGKDFLETALRSWLGDPMLKVKEFVSRIATNKGDNYTSDMFRVTVVCEQRDDPISIVIKRMISSGGAGDFFFNSTAHAREEQMLKTILPEMHSLLKKVVSDVEPIGAGYVYSTPGVLAMEDLQKEGFQMAQRLLGLDLDHCSLVIRTLARFHATSVRIMELKSIDLSIYRESFIAEPQAKAENEGVTVGMVRALSDELKNFPGLEKYSSKLSALLDRDFFELIIKDVEDNHEDDFLVMVHADLWVNNMMFRYSSSGKPDGVRFVDLQTPSIASPAIDLQYFLTTSPNETVRTTCFDQLIKEYHKLLCETMAALECSTRPPTLEQLKADYDKKTHIGMYTTFTILPVILGEAGMFDFGDMLENGKPRKELFRSKYLRKALEWFLPIYDRKGFL